MERHKVIILKRECYSNTSLMLSVWSRRSGWMEVTARGVMRPRNHRLGDLPDEFDVSEIVIYRKPEAIQSVLVQHEVLETAVNIRSESRRLDPLWQRYCGLAALRELLSAIWRGYPADEKDAVRIYNILAPITAESEKTDSVIVCIAGAIKILAVAGITPQAGDCAVCGTRVSTGGWILSWSEGGLTCRQCAVRAGRMNESPLLDQGLAEILGRISTESMEALAPLRAPSAQRTAMLLQALTAWCEGVLDIRARGFQWLGQILEGAKA